MKFPLLISGIAWAVALACIALPLVVRTHFQAEVRHNRESVRAQEEQLQVLQSKTKVPSTDSNAADPLTTDELSELLRLRGQIALLRQQTNLVEKLRQENAQLKARPESRPPTPQSGTQFAEELSADTVSCMEAILKELPSASARFAAYNEGKPPSHFDDLKDYLTRDGHRLTGVYTFEFVRGEGPPKPSDALILRERMPRRKEDNMLRVYGFADGRAVEMSFPDFEGKGKEEIRWERAQLGLSPPTFEE
jgi:hypothetical protein